MIGGVVVPHDLEDKIALASPRRNRIIAESLARAEDGRIAFTIGAIFRVAPRKSLGREDEM